MTKLEKDERVQFLWKEARKYNNQLRFKARLAKMSEKNMHLDAQKPTSNELLENVVVVDNESKKEKIPWYLIDSESSSYKFWDFILTMMIIYC